MIFHIHILIKIHHAIENVLTKKKKSFSMKTILDKSFDV